MSPFYRREGNNLVCDTSSGRLVLVDLGNRYRLDTDPSAIQQEVRTHKRHPEIHFATGISLSGKNTVKWVEYDKSLGEDRIVQYAINAKLMIDRGECPYCKEGENAGKREGPLSTLKSGLMREDKEDRFSAMKKQLDMWKNRQKPWQRTSTTAKKILEGKDD